MASTIEDGGAVAAPRLPYVAQQSLRSDDSAVAPVRQNCCGGKLTLHFDCWCHRPVLLSDHSSERCFSGEEYVSSKRQCVHILLLLAGEDASNAHRCRLTDGGGLVSAHGVHWAKSHRLYAYNRDRIVGKCLIPPATIAANVIEEPRPPAPSVRQQRNHVVMSNQTWVGI